MVFGPDGNLYVASWRDSDVRRYNGTTGAYINEFVVRGAGAAKLTGADGVIFGPDGNFYVSSESSNEVKRYNGTTGAFIDNYVSCRPRGTERPSLLPLHSQEPGHGVAGYDYVKPITIDRTKIPGTCGTTLASYPMLFSVTDPDLRYTGSGGKVKNSLGYDIIFKGLDATTCGAAPPCTLDHEIENTSTPPGSSSPG